MRETHKILSIISERGKKKKSLQRVYRLLYNPQLYLTAYQNIYANDGAMTKGINDETVDGMSMKKIYAIIEKLKTETYRWSPARKTHIKKRNGKPRPLGLPTWSDKLLQEVIYLILDAYYDNQFSNDSHGFRKGRGCKTALEAIAGKSGWNGTKWFVEGDVSNCFGSIDHQILLDILREKIEDNRFLRLIGYLLKTGYLENGWRYNKTLSGCPQGNILSPLLSNLYMNKLDQYVKQELKPQHTTGKIRVINKEYQKMHNQIATCKQNKNWAKVKEFRKTLQSMPSKDPLDPDFKRLRFIRYADDWLVGIAGSRKDAEEVKDKIALYLQTELKLQLNQEKTLITHARTEKARFLGYDIHVLHDDAKHTGRRRSINGKVGLRVPKDKMQLKMSRYMANGKPCHRAEIAFNSDYDIIRQYQTEFRGFVQYYTHAYNAHQMRVVKRTMELSLVKTLANKHKLSAKKVFKKYQTVAETRDGVYKVLETRVERDGKKPLIAQFGGIKLGYDKNADIIDVSKQFFNARSQLIDRLTHDVCELCEATGDIEMHHIRKLKDLSRNDRRHKPEWMKRMIAMRRKTLAVCTDCHVKIHSGVYDRVCVH